MDLILYGDFMPIASLDEVIINFIENKLYEIRDDGTIWSCLHKNGSGFGNLRRFDRRNKNGYQVVRYKDISLQVHRIIYAKFKGPLKKELQINHINGIKYDNRPVNLELVTDSGNQLHSYRVLKNPPVVGNKKIDKNIAEQIREDHKKGESYNKLKIKYKLSKSSIGYIVNNKTWKS